MRRSLAVLPLLVIALIAPASAGAQAGAPDDAPVVAGPTATGARLVAFDARGTLCVLIRARTGDSGDDPTCQPPPRRATESIVAYRYGGDERAWHAGVVPADVATVELRFARAPSITVATTPGDAYRGRAAGRVRFFLADGLPQAPYFTRYLDADGRALGAAAQPFEMPAVGRPVVLARARSGGRRVALRAQVTRRLAPTPLQRDRLARAVCLRVIPSPVTNDTMAHCPTEDEPPRDLVVATDQSCRAHFLTVRASPRTRQVVAVLGDGRRRRVALRSAARVGLDERVGFLIVPRTSVRRVLAFGEGGERIDTEELLLSPPGSQCADPRGGGGTFLVRSSQRAPSGPLAFAVADDGVRLCVTLGDLVPDRDCALPPVEPEEARILRRSQGGETLVAGVVPAEVAAVELRVGDALRRVETTAAGPYSGQYREHLRFFSFTVPGRVPVSEGRLLDADGRGLGVPFTPDTARLAAGPRTVARRPVRITIGAVELDFGPRIGCVTVGPAPADFVEGCFTAFPGIFVAEARCAPRRVVVAGGVAATTRRVEAVLADGRRIRARLIRPPARFGVRAKAFVLVLPPRAALRRVEVAGRVGRVGHLRLPPAAEQCGYFDLGTLDQRRR